MSKAQFGVDLILALYCQRKQCYYNATKANGHILLTKILVFDPHEIQIYGVIKSKLNSFGH